VSWLHRLLRRDTRPPADLAERVERWRSLPAAAKHEPLADARIVVVDVETSSLDVQRADLLAIGACVVRGRRLEVGGGFELVLRYNIEQAHDTVLIHGIGPQELEAGEDPALALMEFLEYAGKSPLVAFHAPFDRRMLEREARRLLGVRMPHLWLDLAWLAPALYPEASLQRAGLDHWLQYFGLAPHERHRAIADALVTGELFLVLLDRACRQGVQDWSRLSKMAAAQERLSHGGGLGGA
jgi:DNA polymerase-3 subunit epsilon